MKFSDEAVRVQKAVALSVGMDAAIAVAAAMMVAAGSWNEEDTRRYGTVARDKLDEWIKDEEVSDEG